MSVLRCILPAFAFLVAAQAARPDPAAPTTAPGIRIVTIGVYCRFGGVLDREADPWSKTGYVNVVPDDPVFNFRQQMIPARLGLHFGLLVVSDRDIPQVLYALWKPGNQTPNVWEDNFDAYETSFRGEAFGDADELVPGIWRMEAYDGMKLLYRVEWEVLPATYAPEITSFCHGPS